MSVVHRSGHARLHHSLAIAGAHAPHPIVFALCGRFRTPTRSAQQRRAHRSERTKTMTVVAPRWPTRLQPNNFVLATDLDGTLLAGSLEARRRVRELFAARASGTQLTNSCNANANAMTATLHQALSMGEDERAYRTARMGMIVAEHDVARWGDDFLAAVAASGAAPIIADAA